MERPMEGMNPGMPPMSDEPPMGAERPSTPRPARPRAAAKPKRKAKAKPGGAKRRGSAKRSKTRSKGRAKAKSRRSGGKEQAPREAGVEIRADREAYEHSAERRRLQQDENELERVVVVIAEAGQAAHPREPARESRVRQVG